MRNGKNGPAFNQKTCASFKELYKEHCRTQNVASARVLLTTSDGRFFTVLSFETRRDDSLAVDYYKKPYRGRHVTSKPGDTTAYIPYEAIKSITIQPADTPDNLDPAMQFSVR